MLVLETGEIVLETGEIVLETVISPWKQYRLGNRKVVLETGEVFFLLFSCLSGGAGIGGVEAGGGSPSASWPAPGFPL